MTNADAVAAVNAIAAFLFVVLVFVGAGRTMARLFYYRAHKARRPRLLNRDATVFGGFALGTGSILLVRFLGLASLVRDSVPWTVFTAACFVVAVGTYAYYEVAVIERGQP